MYDPNTKHIDVANTGWPPKKEHLVRPDGCRANTPFSCAYVFEKKNLSKQPVLAFFQRVDRTLLKAEKRLQALRDISETLERSAQLDSNLEIYAACVVCGEHDKIVEQIERGVTQGTIGGKYLLSAEAQSKSNVQRLMRLAQNHEKFECKVMRATDKLRIFGVQNKTDPGLSYVTSLALEETGTGIALIGEHAGDEMRRTYFDPVWDRAVPCQSP